MKFLHTADWHIGQMFYNFDRTPEHIQFLDWLTDTIAQESIDAVLISGDIFDTVNPSAESVRLFYAFLNKAVQLQPLVQIIAIAGNHDSAARFESPRPLLESSRIHLIGTIDRKQTGGPDFSKLLIRLKDRQGRVKAQCLAVPYLRPGDLPRSADGPQTYAEGVEAFYREAYRYVETTSDAKIPLIVMGHLHISRAEITDHDKHERVIMGGIEGISPDIFGEQTVYTALGHIHKAQHIQGNGNIRYSGSPIPMSFSEQRYQHRVLISRLDDNGAIQTVSSEVPIAVPLMRVPEKHAVLDEVVELLKTLPDNADHEDLKPFLEVRVLLDQPEPALRHVIDRALENKCVRLARIDTRYPGNRAGASNTDYVNPEALRMMNAEEVFGKTYASVYSTPAPESIMRLFREVLANVQTEGE